MTNPKDVLKHHVTGAIERGEKEAIVEQPVSRMSAYLAIGILDGFEQPRDAAEVIEAARWIRDHGPRGVLAGSGTSQAILLADLADRDYEAAIDHLKQTNG